MSMRWPDALRADAQAPEYQAAMSAIAELKQPPFAEFLGIKLTHVSPERVTAELLVRNEIATMPAIIHGGAIMALADNVGAVGTVVNLPEGAGTTTIESKTNFFAAIPVGETAYAECTPLHRGRTTMVWQTKITRADGRLCALVTQTQLVLQPKKG
jgi:1,4-dihydroxy-2-naphthoyl-CoA hydrolase